jgi:hypothetical protein
MLKRYPTIDDIAEMRARGYDRSVIEEATVLSERGELIREMKSKIRAAFTGVKLGAGIGLYQAQGLDDYADETTCAAYRQKDEKDNWEAIPVAHLNECNSSLSFFDAEGMRFHLPAYLIADLDGEYRFGMAFCLAQCPGKQFSQLSESQVVAVRDYLAFIEVEPDYAFDREHIHRAIEEYWTR